MCSICKLRPLTVLIGCVFLACQTALLVLTLTIIGDVEAHVNNAFHWVKHVFQGEHEALEEVREIEDVLVRRSSDFVAIPITLNIVLMVSNCLLLWATASKHKILIWPWMVLYAIEWICLLTVMIYCIIVVPKSYMKVIVFLIVCPFLVMFSFCWFVVKCFYNFLRDLNHKEAVAAVYSKEHMSNSNGPPPYAYPPTVYSTSGPDHHHWDQQPPVWATQALVWDPNVLQKMDPRYATSNSMHRTTSSPVSYYKKSSAGSSVGGSRKRREVTPTVLPDGTLVVPITEEDSDDLSQIREDDREEADEVGSLHSRRRHASRTTSSSLSDKFRHHHGKTSPRSHATSDDGTTSVVSLSDKYRQQDEMEVFEEFYPVPKPVPPPSMSSGKSPETQSTVTGDTRY